MTDRMDRIEIAAKAIAAVVAAKALRDHPQMNHLTGDDRSTAFDAMVENIWRDLLQEAEAVIDALDQPQHVH